MSELLIGELNALSDLEPGWYANVGAKTGERCCKAMREAAATLERMERERDETRAIAEIWADAHDEIQAHAAAMRKALEPFAAMAGTTIRFTATDSTRVFVDTEHFKAARAVLAAISAPAEESSVEVPAGWALVPVEPTEEMIAAAVEGLGLPWREIQRLIEGYRRMLNAAAPAEARAVYPATLDAVEVRAEQIYNGWGDVPGWVPWVVGGNSTKQDDARREARSEQAEGGDRG